MRALPAIGYDLVLVTGKVDDSPLKPTLRALLTALVQEDESDSSCPTRRAITACTTATIDDLELEALERTLVSPSDPFHQLNVHLIETLESLNDLEVAVDHIAILVAGADETTGMKKSELVECRKQVQLRPYDCWMQRISLVVLSKGWMTEIPTFSDTIPTFVCHSEDTASIRQLSRILRKRTRLHNPLLAVRP